MLLNAFIGRPRPPTDPELANALGTSKKLWDSAIAELAAELGVAVQEWNSYSPKAGWSLRLRVKKRVILYLSPCQGCFRASFALGEKAVLAAHQSNLPAKLLKLIDEATRYPEGTGVRFEVKTSAELKAVKMLAQIKLKN